MSRTANALALVIGAGAAVLSDRGVRALAPRQRTELLAVGLPVAAAIYPLARTGWHDSRAVAGEVGGLLAYGAIGAWGAARAADGGNRIAALGWLTHAGFDAVHEPGAHSRIPRWYPAMCAGYDVTLAALLARS